MPDQSERHVAISYAWATEKEGDSSGKVEEFCTHLKTLGVKVLRDVDQLVLGDSLSKFMTEIGTSDFLCVFLSKAYLESPNCLNELFIAWEIGHHNPEEFRKHVKIWVMPDAADAYSPDGRAKWSRYWNAKRDEMAKDVKELAGNGLAPADLDVFEQIKRFSADLSRILAFVKDTLNPTSIDELQRWAEAEFPTPSPEEISRQLEATFDQTIKEMNRILADHPEVAKFLLKSSPQLVTQTPERKGWLVAKSVANQQVDGTATLEEIRDGIETFYGGPMDWKKLCEFVGGICVLSADREWVLAQRAAWKRGESLAMFKRHDVRFAFELDAHFLPLVISALANGCVEINRLFGEFNPRHLSAGSVVITELGEDRRRKNMIAFTRAVLGSSTRINEADLDDVQRQFGAAVQAIRFAAVRKRDPYFATDESYVELREDFIASHRDLEHLLLIPAGGKGDIDDVIPEFVEFFSLLYEIFEIIKARLLSA